MANFEAVNPQVSCGGIVDDKLSSFQCDHRPHIGLVPSHIPTESQYGTPEKDRIDVDHESRDLMGT